MNDVLLISGMFAVTFAARYPMLVLVGRIQLPGQVFAALKFVPVAVLTAISAPIMLAGDTDTPVNLAIDNAHLIGGVAAIVVAAAGKKLLPTIIVGMGVFLLWRGMV
jgi:branched-subunit amino acid transport protein